MSSVVENLVVTPEIEILVLDLYDDVTTELFTSIFEQSVKQLHIKLTDSLRTYSYERFRNVISPGLKSFHFEGTRIARLNGLWEIIGSSLEEVSITIMD